MFRSFRKLRPDKPGHGAGFSPQQPLLKFTKRDAWTIGDACEGTQIFGGTGSGKTSGSGRAIAHAMLAAGFGGMVLTVKRDERDTWLRYAEAAGRGNSVIVFSERHPHRFNFLEYLRRSVPQPSLAESVVEAFSTTLGAMSGGDRRSHADPFWQDSLNTLIRNAVSLIVLAGAELSLPLIADVIASGPQDAGDLNDPAWRSSSECWRLLAAADSAMSLGQPPYTRADSDLQTTARYWCREFAGLAPNTRSSITAMFTSKADRLLRGQERELFCEDLNISPEVTHDGAILIIDIPVLEYGDFGRFAQVLWKHCWQRAAERRTVDDGTRPIFLWADEAQQFVTEQDAVFQSTARSSRVCTVYLTQNLASYNVAMQGEGGQHAAENLLGNLQTKIFHANSHAETNEWAERLAAKDWQTQVSTSTQDGPQGGREGGASKGRTVTSSTSRSLESLLLPQRFAELRTGGHANGGVVDGIVFQSGRVWRSTGRNFLQTSFKQSG